MRRMTQWIIGGLLTTTLWASGVGAQTFPHMRHDLRHNRPERHQDRQDIQRDHWAGRHTTVTPDRADWHRDRDNRGRDRHHWRHRWHHGWHHGWHHDRRDWSYRR